VFILRNDNTLEKRDLSANADGVISGSQNLRGSGSKLSQQTKRAGEIIGDLELEETGTHKNPLTRQYQYPRFFVIAGDGSARELISEDQLAYSMRKKKIQNESSIKQKMADVVNNSTVENHYFLTKVVNMKETELEH
jgi:hypothetical protein